MHLWPGASSFFCVRFICLSALYKSSPGSKTPRDQMTLVGRQQSSYYGDRFRQGSSQMSWANVYQFVKRIPRGRVITYGALAKALRLPGGARTAGRAMAGTPPGKGIPWHRVVGDRGKLLIREPYASLQRKLLETEGVKLLESRVDLKTFLWRPSKSQNVSSAQKPRKKRRT
jgi:methylated-DNA-protein-cysteine methyltransferase related protein